MGHCFGELHSVAVFHLPRPGAGDPECAVVQHSARAGVLSRCAECDAHAAAGCHADTAAGHHADAACAAVCRYYHYVQWGQTLSGIAWYYGTTIQAIMYANPSITNPNLIYAGSTLCIP